MKWSDFEAKYPDQYPKAKQLCEEILSERKTKGGFTGEFCGYCYDRQGWYCFPCSSMKKLYEERFSESLDTILTKHTQALRPQ